MQKGRIAIKQSMKNDTYYMKKALKLAQRGLFTTSANPCVGCVLVKGGKIIGEGFHQYKGQSHAEVIALQKSGKLASDSTAYVTLEPCSHFGDNPPCSDALIDAGVKKVVICNNDPNPLVNGQGITRLEKAGIEVIQNVKSKKGEQLNCGFFHRMKTGLPFVRIKTAQSLDGRTAMDNGDSFWITGEKARRDVQYWRARSQAIITSIKTVLQDDCRLTVRPDFLPKKYKKLPHDFDKTQPMRVILDSQLKIPLDSKVLQGNGRKIIFTCVNKEQKIHKLAKQGVEVIVQNDCSENKVDIASVLKWLGKENINEVLVEAGATLTGEFIKQKLANELVTYVAPVIMGSGARPLFKLNIEEMKDRLHIGDFKIKRLGKDWRLIASL